MDKNYIYQVPIREWIENDWGKGVFVPVYGGKKMISGMCFFKIISFRRLKQSNS